MISQKEKDILYRKSIDCDGIHLDLCGWEEGRIAMSSTPGITPARQFRTLLLSEQLEFICEAHNGLSAKIVQ